MKKEIAELIRHHASKKVTPFSLKELFLHGKATGDARIRNTQFLHRELPIRLAQRIQDLNHLPGGLTQNRHVQSIIRLYSNYLVSLTSVPSPRTSECEAKYTALLEDLLLDNQEIVLTLARGVLELRNELREFYTPPLAKNVKECLNRFFMARTGLRFIMEQHIAGKDGRRRRGYSGVIEEKCFPADVIKAAADQAESICDRCLGESPSVHILGDTDLSFTYVPHHLHYMSLELLKNALRATVEHARRKHGDDVDEFPPVEVILARGEQDITIKISDKGGGIAFKDIEKVWDFMFSTARMPEDDELIETPGGQAPVLAGYGVGLPLCRIYAEYFGGGLDIMSMEGWGTDAYCHLSRLGDRGEALPKTVAMSPGELDSNYTSGERMGLSS